MSQRPPDPGELLFEGILLRRVPNDDGRWNPECGLPGKLAFAPAKNHSTGEREAGISTYLAHLTSREQVLAGHDQHYGLVAIDIAVLHEAVAALRTRKGVASFGEFTVTFEPIDDPKAGEARHAHCYIEPMPAVIQKELVRLTSPSRVIKPCGPLRPNTGSSTLVDPLDRR